MSASAKLIRNARVPSNYLGHAQFWDRDGFCIVYKRLERGTFQMLTTTHDAEGIELEYSQLVKLLSGLDLRTGRRRRRYRRPG